jgi:hypothetical protein
MEKGKFTKEDIKNTLKFYDSLSVQKGLNDLSVHKEGKELVKSRLNNFEIGRKIMGLEEKFGMGNESDVITKDGIMLIGAFDKVVEIDDDTILIVDYKTSSFAPTKDQLRNDIQLSIYDVVANIKWPNKRIILCLDLLRSDLMFTYRSLEERAEFVDYLKVIHDEMSSFTKKDAVPSINMFCPWCDFKDYCRSYKKVYDKGNYMFELAEKLDNDRLIEEWKRVKHNKKVLEGREKELSSILMEKIKRSGANLIVGEDEEVYVKQNMRKSFNVKTLKSLVPDNEFTKMVYLKNKEVESYLENNPSIKEKVMTSSKVYFTSPYLMIKKGKNL